jgi:hypothetical protein
VIETVTAEPIPLDDRRLEAELSTAYRRHEPSGSATDYDHIMGKPCHTYSSVAAIFVREYIAHFTCIIKFPPAGPSFDPRYHIVVRFCGT